MKIAIIGVGALGSYFGGMLAKAGFEVTLIIRNDDTRQAIAANGLRLDNDDGSHLTQPAVLAPNEAQNNGQNETGEPVDLLMVFTKTGSTSDALASVPELIGPETRLVSLQNGLGNQHVLAKFVPLDHVIYGTTTTPADVIGPGHVSSHGPHLSQFNAAHNGDGAGNAPINPVTARIADEFAAALNNAQMPALVNVDIDRIIWAKVAFNTAMNSICALLGEPAGIVAKVPELTALAHAVAMEGCDVAAACGVSIERDGVKRTISMSMNDHATHKPSMVRDVEAGRLTEIDALNGAVIALGKEHGVPTPYNHCMLALIKAREAQYSS